MADLRLIVSGAAGRMGRMVVRTIHESDGFKLTGALEREDSPWLGQDPALLAGCPAKGLQIVADPLPLLLDADAIIDFSSPAASVALAGLAAQARIADVIGTTGLSDDDLDKIEWAARHAPIVRSGNMSIGVNLLAALTRRAASALGEDFDIEIVEMHHRMKVDAPSGTALLLGEAAAEGRGVCAEGPFGARPRRPDRRAPDRRHRLRGAARRHGRRRSQRHLRRRGRAGDPEPPCRGSRALRPRRAQGRHMGEGPQAWALFDGGRAGVERGLIDALPRRPHHLGATVSVQWKSSFADFSVFPA